MLDVDTGDDLAALREVLSQLDRRAPRTRAALGEPVPRPEGHEQAAPLAGHS
jgi:hypothetical protein